MKTVIKIIIILTVYQAILTIQLKLTRRKLFKLAEARSKFTGKKLVVVGDPDNGVGTKFTGRDYTCGDICVDITGCPGCPNGVKSDLESYLKTIDLNEHIIFISCTIEYIPDITNILEDLSKIPPENLFVVNIQWYNLCSYYYPNFLSGETATSSINIMGPNGKYFKNPFYR
jgi:hypothetical protein